MAAAKHKVRSDNGTNIMPYFYSGKVIFELLPEDFFTCKVVWLVAVFRSRRVSGRKKGKASGGLAAAPV